MPKTKSTPGFKVVLSFSIPLEMANALQELAEHNDVTVQVFVRRILDREIQRSKGGLES